MKRNLFPLLIVLVPLLAVIGFLLMLPSRNLAPKKSAVGSSKPPLASVYTDFHLLSTSEQDIVLLPFKAKVLPGGKSVSRETYCHGNYGITELGKVRLAVRGLKFSGSSNSTSIPVYPTSSGTKSGITGTGNRKFVYDFNGFESVCHFGGYKFTVKNGFLYWGGTPIQVNVASVLFIDEKGRAEKVYLITGKEKSLSRKPPRKPSRKP
ncbi:hypothetical protein GF373_00890 [bacterium]|nr:hypothetical protein [bacterium]